MVHYLVIAAVALVLVLEQCQSFSFSLSFNRKAPCIQCTKMSPVPVFSVDRGRTRMTAVHEISSDVEELQEERLSPPNREDMHHLAYLLANMTDHLDTAPEVALTIVSQEMGWLFSKDVPRLTQMLLTELPELRKDKVMMRAYMFLLDFLEAISKETVKRLKVNQKVMRSLLEAAKVSESKLDSFVSDNADKLLSPDFMVYLDSEIEGTERNSPSESLLVTIKLRLLDEQGKKMGVDVTLLPKLASEADPAELRRKTIMHLDMYDNVGKELFLQTLRIMLGELEKRYQQVDPILKFNLQEVEKITLACLEVGSKQ